MPGGAFESGSGQHTYKKKVAERKGEPLETGMVSIFLLQLRQDEICIDAIDEMCDVLGGNCQYLLYNKS